VVLMMNQLVVDL